MGRIAVSKALVVGARALASLAFAIVIGGSQVAQAQQLPTAPPIFSTIDDNGVDLASGRFNYSTTEVVIGQPGSGGLAYTRTFIGPGWRDNFAGTINSAGAIYTVSVGASSETFTLSNGTFTSNQAIGSTLSLNSGIYTYTLADGTIASFDAALAGGGMLYDANVARITSLTAPTGEQISYFYKSITVQSVPAMRLQAVTNNLGYQIHFDYSLNSPTTSGQLAAWKTQIRVTGINMAEEYCDPNADTCSLSGAWPYATYAISGSSNEYETVTDPLGNATRYTIGTRGLVGIRHPTSTTIDQTYVMYSVTNRVQRVETPFGSYTYTYSGTTNVTTTATDPLAHTRTVVTNANALPTSDTDGEGRTRTFAYDSNNRLDRLTLPEGNYYDFDYDGRGNLIQTTVVAKSGSGLSNIVTSASFPSTCSIPVTCNQPTATTDALGNVTDYTYDSTHGGVTSITLPDPDGASPLPRPQTRFTYASLYAYYKNSAGSIVAAPSAVTRLTEVSSCATGTWSGSACTDGANTETRAVTSYGSNGVANNRLPISQTTQAGDNSLSVSTGFTYDATGNLLTVDGPLSGAADTTRYRYDAGRRLIGIVAPDPDGGGALKYPAVRVTRNADGYPTVTERGTVNGQSDADWAAFVSLAQITTTYDVLDRPRMQTATANGITHAVVQNTFNNANLLECTAQRMNAAIFAALPASACTLGAAGPNGPDRIIRYTYNAADQPMSMTSGYGSANPATEWTISYANNGLAGSATDAGGHVTTLEYDGFDRLRKIRFPNPSSGGSSTTDYEQYLYNAGSAVSQVRRRDGATLTTTYDNLLRPTLIDASANGQDVAYTYDNFSRVLTAADGINTIVATYDQLSRQLTQTNAIGTVGYQYDAAGRRTRITWPDAFCAQYSYNLSNALTGVAAEGAGCSTTTLATYTYDDLGRRVAVSRGNGTSESATFDDAGLLATLAQDVAGSSDDQTLSYSYNNVGQIVSRNGTNANYAWTPIAPGSTNYSSNNLNQYTTVGGAAQSYDGRGNLQTGSFGYDIRNQLVSGPNSASLTYDPVGNLFEVGSGAGVIRFLNAGTMPLGEYDSSNQVIRRYVPGASINETIVWYEGASATDRRWLLADERGSVIAVTDDSGVATSINRYDEFGIPDASNSGRFQYTGQMWLPDLQRYNYRARIYAPNNGRFQQPDPLLWAGGDANVYTYVSNDPLNFIDPSGLCEFFSVVVNGPGAHGIDNGLNGYSYTVGIGSDCFGYGGLFTGLGGTSGRTGAGAEFGGNDDYRDRFGIDDDGRPLNRCERRALWGRLPHNAIDAARIHDHVPSWLGSDFGGITIGRDILFRPGIYSGSTSAGLGLLAEEVGHVSQYLASPQTWGTDYVGQAFFAALAGGDAYWDNVYEQMAQLTRADVVADIERDGVGNGCPS